MFCFVYIQERLSAVLCVTAQFEVEQFFKGDLCLQYSVSTFHYHAVFFEYCP